MEQTRYGKVRLMARLSYCLLLQNLKRYMVSKSNISKITELRSPKFCCTQILLIIVLLAWLRTVPLFPSALLMTLCSYSPSVPSPPPIWFFGFSFLFRLWSQFLHSASCQVRPCCPLPVSAMLLFLRVWVLGGVLQTQSRTCPKTWWLEMSSVAGRSSWSKYAITLRVRIDACQVHREAMKHFAAKLLTSLRWMWEIDFYRLHQNIQAFMGNAKGIYLTAE